MERINLQDNISSMLQTIRAYQAKAGGAADGPGAMEGSSVQGSSPAGFSEAIKAAIHSVNELQMKARSTTDAYERGEGVPLTDVVLSMQKSSIAFEATLQVRNKVLKAYEDILNMPV
ncbi:MAG: Flagellar hook-basal body complex protein FliE [Pseudomonadota bacterium]|jgi:flagellar hook-basal body complex protein FliE